MVARGVLTLVAFAACREPPARDGVGNESPPSTRASTTLADTASSADCLRRPFVATVEGASTGPVAAGTTLHYDVTVVDADSGDCPSTGYSVALGDPDPSVVAAFAPSFLNATPGQSLTFGLDVTGLADGDPGAHALVVGVVKGSLDVSERQFLRVTYDLEAPPGCVVSKRSELMITSTSVVDDPVRTFGNVDSVTPPPPSDSRGVWSFGHLMRALAPCEQDAPALVERLLSLWLTDQNVNGFVVSARPALQSVVLDRWPRTPSGALDLDRAPLRLQAIVNRVDLRDLSRHSAGEGRFVFAFDIPAAFTLILEYDLPAETASDVLGWAEAWHALSSFPFGSEAYRAALEGVTRRFTERGASPARPNGSALLRLRTNEVALAPRGDGRWELRQFELAPDTGFFVEAPVSETPDRSLNGSTAFADFVNQNQAAIVAAIPGSSPGIVPASFEGRPFLAGSAINDLPVGVAWNGPGLDPVTRFHASINTCNGCHGFDTQSVFFQIRPREPGFEASLSPFLLGVTIFEPGGPFVLGDLARRKDDLRGLVCPAGSVASARVALPVLR